MKLSSTEAANMSLSEVCKSSAWLRRLLSEFVAKERTSVIALDNMECIKWAKNGLARDFGKEAH